MKRLSLFLLTLTGTLLSFSLTISNPVYKYRSGKDIQLVKVVLSDTATIFHFVENNPNGCSLGKRTYIQPTNGGEKMEIRYAVGLPQPLGEKWVVKENKPLAFSLIFPKIDKTINEIDFCESFQPGIQGVPWRIIGIELNKSKYSSLLPEKLLGNWFKMDGSNLLQVSFSEKLAVMDTACWSIITVQTVNTKIRIDLEHNNRNRNVEVEFIDKNNIKMIEVGKESFVCSRTQKFDANSHQPTNQLSLVPFFKQDTAVYCGYINGFTSNFPATIEVNYEDIISGKLINVKSKIDKLGYFEVHIFMNCPQRIRIIYPGFENEFVLLQPGKKTFHLIKQESDVPNFTNKGSHSCCFMGDNAALNDEIHIRQGFGSIYKNINEMMAQKSFIDAKKLVDQEYQNELNLLDNYKTERNISQSAEQLIRTGIIMRRLRFLSEYNSMKINHEMKTNPKSFGEFFKGLKRTEADSVFIHEFKDQFIMPGMAVDFRLNGILKQFVSNTYLIPINTLKKLPALFAKSIELKGIILKGSEKSLADSMEIIYNDTTITKKYRTRLIQLFSTYQAELKQTMYDVGNARLYESVGKLFKKEPIISDLVRAHILNKKFNGYILLSEDQLKKETDSISDPFIVSQIVNQNNELRKNIMSNKANTISIKCEVPQTDPGKLFDAIMLKYKDRAVYVDFWATWCGPCLRNMKEMKQLKVEMKKEDVAFIYITNATSPQKLWENMIPEIDGDHYRLTSKEWDVLSKKFNIVSIPHAVLVNKSGEVVSPKIQGLSNDEVKILINSALDQK